MTASNEPITPNEILTQRKQKSWKPDAAGRLLFRSKGLFGAAYVVETIDQLSRVEAYNGTKNTLMVIVAGTALGTTFFMKSDASLWEAFGRLFVVAILVVALVLYSAVGGSRLVLRTGMRRSV